MNNGETSALISEQSEEPPSISSPTATTNLIDSNLKNFDNKVTIKFNVKIENDNFQEINPQTGRFKSLFFPNVTPQEWNNWRWQINHSITDYRRLEEIFGMQFNQTDFIEQKLPVRITPYYASIIFDNQKLRKTVIPSVNELKVSEGEAIDPLAEDHDRPAHCIVHRYPDRVLFLATNFCSSNCRYCTRSRIVSNRTFNRKHMIGWEQAFEYIRSNPQVRDVVISGGDPLTLPDFSIDFLLSQICSIPHVEIVRIGTKVPVVLPMRINKSLLKIFKKYKPLYMSIHCTHPAEFSPEVRSACNQIADAGVVMGSQTVLLKEVNDDPVTMKSLMHELLKVRIRPYYLYQCDPIMGSAHFRTPVETGINIMENLRGWTSGYAIPHYVIDAPGGGGKIPILPEYNCGKDAQNNIKLRNYENKFFIYPNSL